MVQSVTICVSYILNALFRDTPLAYSFCTSCGQVARWQVARWTGLVSMLATIQVIGPLT